MSGPTWLSWPFAGLMIVSALYHAGRLAAARHVAARVVAARHVASRQRGRSHPYDVDLTHLAISTAMAAMLVTSFGENVTTAWLVVFAVPTLWFLLRGARALTSGRAASTCDGGRALLQPLQRVGMCAAMLFMLVVAGPPASAPAAVSSPAALMPGMAMGDAAAAGGSAIGGPTIGGPTIGGPFGHASGSSTALVLLTSLVLVTFLCLAAARHARQLTDAVATQRAWTATTTADSPVHGIRDLRRRTEGLLLAAGPSLGCQLAMSGTMIYMLVLTV